MNKTVAFIGLGAAVCMTAPAFAQDTHLSLTKESRVRIAALDAKLAEKKNGKKSTQPEQKEEPHEREDH